MATGAPRHLDPDRATFRRSVLAAMAKSLAALAVVVLLVTAAATAG